MAVTWAEELSGWLSHINLHWSVAVPSELLWVAASRPG